MDLRSTGSQQIQYVGVDDVYASGQWLAVGQTNQGGGTNVVRWFGLGDGVQVIPTLGGTALALLAASLGAAGAWLTRRNERDGALRSRGIC